MEHYMNRKRHQDRHRLGRRSYFKHVRDDSEPPFDLGDLGLDEIRERIHGASLAPFRDDPRRDELGEAIDELSAEE